MKLGEPKDPEALSLPQQSHLNIQQAFTNFQNKCSTSFVRHLSHLHPFNPDPSFFNIHLQSALSNLQNQAKHVLDSVVSTFNPGFSNLGLARINDDRKTPFVPARRRSAAMPTEAIEERLAGVPVYALSNSSEEFVLVSGVSSGNSLGLFCFKKEDAEALLEQIRTMDPATQNGSKVVTVPLNKVFQLKVDGVSFRFIPESAQVKNALQEREKIGISAADFSGVPVFQSRSLILRSENKSYRPAFFRKEDLDDSLFRASSQQNQLNPALKPGDIQVGVLEEVIKGMKDSSDSTWDDIVFIPPGFDVSTDPKDARNRLPARNLDRRECICRGGCAEISREFPVTEKKLGGLNV